MFRGRNAKNKKFYKGSIRRTKTFCISGTWHEVWSRFGLITELNNQIGNASTICRDFTIAGHVSVVHWDRLVDNISIGDGTYDEIIGASSY